jgi:hypothetical protein
VGGSEGARGPWRQNRCCTHINVNLESIIIICNWIDGLMQAKALHSVTF